MPKTLRDPSDDAIRKPLRVNQRDEWQHFSHERWCVPLLIIVTLLTFARCCGNEFVTWDDPQTINAPEFHDKGIGYFWAHPQIDIYIPMTYTVWGLLRPAAQEEDSDPSGWQLNPWIYHSANVLVHLLAALAVYAIFQQLLSGLAANSWPACIGAMFFAVHPVQVEAVAWASGLKDVLAGCLSLIALWQYIRFARSHGQSAKWHYIAATCAFIAAMLAKPSAAMMPLIVLAIDYWLLRRSPRQILGAVIPWVILAIPILVVARMVQESIAAHSIALWHRPLIAGASLCFYLWKILWPQSLGLDYGWRLTWITAQPWFYELWMIPVAIGAAFWLMRKRIPWLWVSALVFVFALLPTLGFVAYDFQVLSNVADHYLYLAMLGPALALAWLVSRFPQWLRSNRAVAACYALLAIALLALGVRAIFQEQTWKDDFTLWQHTLAVNSTSCLAETHLGYIDQNQGEQQKALHHFQAAIADDPEILQPRIAAVHALHELRLTEAEDAQGVSLLECLSHLPPKAQQNSTSTLFDLAFDMLQARRFDRALLYARQGRALVERETDAASREMGTRAAQALETRAIEHHPFMQADAGSPVTAP